MAVPGSNVAAADIAQSEESARASQDAFGEAVERTGAVSSGQVGADAGAAAPVAKLAVADGEDADVDIEMDDVAEPASYNTTGLVEEIVEVSGKAQPVDDPRPVSAHLRAKFGVILSHLDILMHHKHSWPFNQPVDAAGLGLDEYHDVIKAPMDLGTVQKKLLVGDYKSVSAANKDIDLVWKNAQKFNEAGSDVYNYAAELKALYKYMSEHDGKIPPAVQGRMAQKKLTDVCEKCHTRGFLVYCSGNCGQGWHLECKELPEDLSAWRCEQCAASYDEQRQRSFVEILDQMADVKDEWQELDAAGTEAALTAWKADQGEWLVATAPSGADYFYHKTTRQTTWSLPEGAKLFKERPANVMITHSRPISDMFMDLPDREDLPEYFDFIKTPMSINLMRERLKQTPPVYPSVNRFVEDFELIVSNAHRYNDPESQIFQDATSLLNAFRDAVATYFPEESRPKVRHARSESRGSARKKDRSKSKKGKKGKKSGSDFAYEQYLAAMERGERLVDAGFSGSEEEYSDKDDIGDVRMGLAGSSRRRSGRARNRTTYAEVNTSDEESSFESDEMPTPKKNKRRSSAASTAAVVEDEEDGEKIDQIYGHRFVSGVDETDQTVVYNPASYDYFVKWQNLAHVHCEWVSHDRLVGGRNQGAKARLRNYWTRFRAGRDDAGIFVDVSTDETELFNQSYIEIDRIVAERTTKVPAEEAERLWERSAAEFHRREVEKAKHVHHAPSLADIALVSGQLAETRPDFVPGTFVLRTEYLVKWKNLPYTEATWESSEVINDDSKIEEFRKFNTIPKDIEESMTYSIARPKFVELEQDREFKDKNKLRSYQVEGVNWLTFNYCERRGSILADEMGLGKTVQSTIFIMRMIELSKTRGPFLIIAPLSTIGHWEREINEWTDLNAVVYLGSNENRELIRKYDFHFLDERGNPHKKHILKFNVLITTPEMLLADDWTELGRFRYKCSIVDEAQRIKNAKGKLIENLRELRAEHRVLLTGTPLQNNTTELWSLLNFIEPESFNSLESFLEEFGDLKDSAQVEHLHKVIAPHLLRRMKDDVEKSIPPKEEMLVEVDLTPIQKTYYRAILEGNRDFLNRGIKGKNVPSLLNVVMELRKVCNHPFLIKGVEDKECKDVQNDDEYIDKLVKTSTKMILLDKLLPKLQQDGHKVLIFSQMVKVLDLLETYMRHRRWGFERIDGGVVGNDRQQSIDRFTNDPKRFVFLLCTRAGGMGINLTAADTVIIFDSDWNPQNDVQAQARAHRIGQEAEVKVYRLISSKTYERQMFERASMKLGLDQAVLHGLGKSVSDKTAAGDAAVDLGGGAKLSKHDINQLLKYGAYDLFNEKEEDRASFVEDDIDQILRRSTKVVWDKGSEPGKEKQKSTFSSATFQSNTDGAAIDLDDPDFWERILPEARDAQNLHKKLLTNDGEAVFACGEKARAEYVDNVGTLVDEVTEAFEKGRSDVAQLQAVLLPLLELCQAKIEQFSVPQRTRLLTWYADITKPRRRKRGEIQRLGSRVEDRSKSKKTLKREKKLKEKEAKAAAKAEAKAEKKEKKHKKKRGVGGTERGERDSEFSHWHTRERRAFHSAFMGFGAYRNRWEDIRRLAQLPRTDDNGEPALSDDDLKKYAVAMLQQCAAHGETAKERQTFVGALRQLLTQISAQAAISAAGSSAAVDASILKAEVKGEAGSTADQTIEHEPDVKSDGLARPELHGSAPEQHGHISTAPTEGHADQSTQPTAISETNGSVAKPTISVVIPDKDKTFGTLFSKRLKSWARQIRLLQKFDQVITFEEGETAREYEEEIERRRQVALEQASSTSDAGEVDVEMTDAIDVDLSDLAPPLQGIDAVADKMADLDRPLTTWWSKASDEALLRGSYKWGLGNYDDMKKDPELLLMFGAPSGAIDSGPSSDATVTITEEHLRRAGSRKITEEWPNVRTLDRQIQMLFEMSARRKEARLRELARLARVEAREQEKLDRQLSKTKDWTKREMTQLRQSVMFWGVPTTAAEWERLASDRAKLYPSKTGEACEEYYHALYARCQSLISSGPDTSKVPPPAPADSPSDSASASLVGSNVRMKVRFYSGNGGEGGGGIAAAAAAAGEDDSDNDEDDDDEDLDVDMDDKESDDARDEEAQDVPETSKSASEQAEGVDTTVSEERSDTEITLPSGALADIARDAGSFVIARKFFRYVNLLTDVRTTVVHHPDLQEMIKNAPRKDLPPWWGPRQDQALLEMSVRIGVAPEAWEDLVRDKKFKIYDDQHGTPSHHPTKEKWLRAFISQRGLERRLEALRDLVLGKKRRSSTGDGSSRLRRTRSTSGSATLSSTEKPDHRQQVRHIDRHPDGTPILPVHSRGADVYSLGTVEWKRPGFSSRNYIWPIGFKSTRTFPSLDDSTTMVTYTSEIVDGGDVPHFRIIPSDRPDMSVESTTSSGAWSEMLKKIKRRHTVSVSGPEMMGFAEPAIKKLIQELPDADKCRDYEWRHFDVDPSDASVPPPPDPASGDSPSAQATTGRSESVAIKRKADDSLGDTSSDGAEPPTKRQRSITDFLTPSANGAAEISNDPALDASDSDLSQ